MPVSEARFTVIANHRAQLLKALREIEMAVRVSSTGYQYSVVAKDDILSIIRQAQEATELVMELPTDRIDQISFARPLNQHYDKQRRD